MSESATETPMFSIEKIYVKDASLEVPNAPRCYFEAEPPSVGVELKSTYTPLENDFHDVQVTVTVTAKNGDKTLFLAEVTQCGVFHIANVPADELEMITAVGCPNILFPYAREAISDAVGRAGFPPVLLAPVNFEYMYRQRQEQLTQGAAPALAS